MKFVWTIIFIGIFFSSCTSYEAPDFEKEKAEILRLHQLQRKYHFEKMTRSFVSMFSDSFISVNRGDIRRPTHEENLVRFGNYFNNVTFSKWDDMTPPVIRFSDDGSMAYTVVDKDVVVSFLDKMKEPIFEKTKFAWVAIYKKYSDGWKIDCVSSTNKESEILEQQEEDIL